MRPENSSYTPSSLASDFLTTDDLAGLEQSIHFLPVIYEEKQIPPYKNFGEGITYLAYIDKLMTMYGIDPDDLATSILLAQIAKNKLSREVFADVVCPSAYGAVHIRMPIAFALQKIDAYTKKSARAGVFTFLRDREEDILKAKDAKHTKFIASDKVINVIIRSWVNPFDLIDLSSLPQKQKNVQSTPSLEEIVFGLKILQQRRVQTTDPEEQKDLDDAIEDLLYEREHYND